MTASVHVLVPDGIDDPAQPSGGNRYDRRMCAGLSKRGWAVHEIAAPGGWPDADAGAHVLLERALARIPDGAVVLLDGLVASNAPEVLLPESRRLRLVVLVHMPLGSGPPAHPARTRDREGRVLAAAAAVVTTSAWTRQWLLDHYRLPADAVVVAEPGVDAAEPAGSSSTGGSLLCVAAVIPAKGHDVLLGGLAAIQDLAWSCHCVGPTTREPSWLDRLQQQAADDGIGDRVRFVGALSGRALEAAYAHADLLVLPSRAETYGMVVTEALAHRLPVVATEVGGVPEALGVGAGGQRPGLLVPPDDRAAFGGALRHWLGDADLRGRLRLAAAERAATLPGWSDTSRQVASVLVRAAA